MEKNRGNHMARIISQLTFMMLLGLMVLGGCAKKTDPTAPEPATVSGAAADTAVVSKPAVETSTAGTATEPDTAGAADETKQEKEAGIPESAASSAEIKGSEMPQYIPAPENAVRKDRPEEGDLIKGKTFFAQVPANRYGGTSKEDDYAPGEFILWLNEVLLSDSGEILQRGKYAVPYIVGNGGNEEHLSLLSGGNDGENPYGEEIWEFTTDENGQVTDAVPYAKKNAQPKKNQEAGYFIEHEGKIYYRLPGKEAMNTSALFGEYMSVYCGPSEIRCFDPETGKSDKLYDSVGCGKMYVWGDCLVAEEKENLVKIPFDKSAPSVLEKPGTQIMAIFDHYMICENDDYSKNEYTVLCRDLENGATTELGKLETFPDSGYPGELQQFYADENSIWFSMAGYEGTGHFFHGAKIYQADVNREASLTVKEMGDIETLPGAAIPEDLCGKYNRAEGFVIRNNTPYLTEGEPAAVEIDYETGELGYYDNDGRRVTAGSGYDTFASEEEDTRINIELTEYAGGRIFLIRNEEWRDPANDIGWREAYVRKYTYVVMEDPDTGEETIADTAMGQMK